MEFEIKINTTVTITIDDEFTEQCSINCKYLNTYLINGYYKKNKCLLFDKDLFNYNRCDNCINSSG